MKEDAVSEVIGLSIASLAFLAALGFILLATFDQAPEFQDTPTSVEVADQLMSQFETQPGTNCEFVWDSTTCFSQVGVLELGNQLSTSFVDGLIDGTLTDEKFSRYFGVEKFWIQIQSPDESRFIHKSPGTAPGPTAIRLVEDATGLLEVTISVA